jgi:hypothetical protein
LLTHIYMQKITISLPDDLNRIEEVLVQAGVTTGTVAIVEEKERFVIRDTNDFFIGMVPKKEEAGKRFGSG